MYTNILKKKINGNRSRQTRWVYGDSVLVLNVNIGILKSFFHFQCCSPRVYVSYQLFSQFFTYAKFVPYRFLGGMCKEKKISRIRSISITERSSCSAYCVPLKGTLLRFSSTVSRFSLCFRGVSTPSANFFIGDVHFQDERFVGFLSPRKRSRYKRLLCIVVTLIIIIAGGVSLYF